MTELTDADIDKIEELLKKRTYVMYERISDFLSGFIVGMGVTVAIAACVVLVTP